MPVPTRLLKCCARAIARVAGNVVLGPIGGEVAVVVIEEIWDYWKAQTNGKDRAEEIQALAQADPEELRAEAGRVVTEEAGGLTEEERLQIEAYLTQIPAAIRRTLRRPSDPSGTTVPAGLELRKAHDLLPYLPPKMPRFRPGDRPLAGVDWELKEMLGVGGFGEVWKATNPHFDGVPPVALKFCLDGTAVAWLRHEAGVLNQVMRQGRHDGVVALMHTYLSADPPCLEYEYVEGGDLAGLVREWHQTGEPPSPERVGQVVLRLAEIVGFMHRLEPPVVHRDLKPANILVRAAADGVCDFKVADFGIGGLAVREAIEQTRRGTASKVLLAMSLRGSCTPLYASPQQMRGEPPDPRDDVYALGVIWHQMLTGDLTKGRPGGKAWQGRLLERGMPADWLDFLLACMEDEPDDRPADAGSLSAELGALVRGMTVQLALPRGGPKTARPALAPGERTGDVEPTPDVMESHVGQRTRSSPTTWGGSFAGETITRDGEVGAPLPQTSVPANNYPRTWGREEAVETAQPQSYGDPVHFPPQPGTETARPVLKVLLWLLLGCLPILGIVLYNADLFTPKARVLQTSTGHTDHITRVAIAPDGNVLASAGQDHTVRLWDAVTGTERASLKGHDRSLVYALAFSPDSRRLATADDGTVRLWDVSTGRLITTLQSPLRHWAVSFSRDGKRLAAVGDQGVTGRETGGLRIWDLENQRELVTIGGQEAPFWSVAFGHDDGVVAVGDEKGTFKLWDTNSGEQKGAVSVNYDRVASLRFSPREPDGLLVGFLADSKVALWDIGTGVSYAETNTKSLVNCLAISDDGNRVAVGSTEAVLIWDVTADEITTLRTPGTWVEAVTFGPGNRVLAAGYEGQSILMWDATPQ